MPMGIAYGGGTGLRMQCEQWRLRPFISHRKRECPQRSLQLLVKPSRVFDCSSAISINPAAVVRRAAGKVTGSEQATSTLLAQDRMETAFAPKELSDDKQTKAGDQAQQTQDRYPNGQEPDQAQQAAKSHHQIAGDLHVS